MTHSIRVNFSIDTIFDFFFHLFLSSFKKPEEANVQIQNAQVTAQTTMIPANPGIQKLIKM